MLENGAVVEMGSYDALKNKSDGIFANFVKNFYDKNNSIEIGIETQCISYDCDFFTYF
jgi:hypothetical protein